MLINLQEKTPKSFVEYFQNELNFQEQELALNQFKEFCHCVHWEDGKKLTFIHSALKDFYQEHFEIPEKPRKINNLGLFYETINLFEQTAELMEYESIVHDDFEYLLSFVPTSCEKFLDWYGHIIKAHPAYTHSFYSHFLRDKASFEDMRYFLAQESTLDPRFDDILALIQIGAPPAAKREIASNYWDEMGNGDMMHMHSRLFQQVLEFFNVSTGYIQETLSLASMISGNLSSYLALHRKNYYKAIGYFAVTEYLVPLRFKHFLKGCQRLGVPDGPVYYHKLHIPIDARHAAGWIKNVLSETIVQNPLAAREVMLGTFYRLNSSKRYLDGLRDILEKNTQEQPAACAF